MASTDDKVLKGNGLAELVKKIKGADKNLSDRIDTLESDSHSHENKTLLDTYDQTNANLSDAVTKKHSHTAAQTNAMNSGITSDKVSSYDTHVADKKIHVTETDKSTWSGKQDKLTNTDSEIQTAVSNSHTHDNKTTLDGITPTQVTNWDNAATASHSHANKTTLDGITSTQVTNWDNAATASHTHSNKKLLDSYDQTNANISDAVSKKHSHSKAQTDAMDSGITASKVSSYDTALTYIPEAASATNKLADQAYVDAIGERLESRYLAASALGEPFATHAALTAATDYYYNGTKVTPNTNDVTVVTADEDHTGVTGEASTTRYRWVGDDESGSWAFEYVINNGALSQAQLLAINSGITSTKVSGYDSHLTNTTVHITSAERTKWNGKQDALSFDGTYNKDTNKAATVSTVTTAIGNLDGSITGTPSASKTLTAFSETDGVVTATFGDISITKSQISDFPTSMTPTSHTHGNITNAGALQTTDVAIANGDKVVITDASNSNKIARSSTAFDGTTTTKALTQKGTFESFATASDITTAIQALDGSITGSAAASKTLTAFSETDGVVTATFGDISITKSQISDFPTSMTPSSHTHGNITNTGALQTTDITIANGDKLVVTDASNSNKVARASAAFDGTTTTTALTPKGTFEAFAKASDITTAIQALDGSITGSAAASKTLTAFSETDGVVTATFGDISITKSQVSDFPTTMTPSSHTHGNITNGGALQAADVTIGDGDKLVITNASDSNKVARASVAFDGTTTTTALTPKGTFEAFAKASDITTAIQALDGSITGTAGAGKTLTAFSETDGVVTATFGNISITKSQISDFPTSMPPTAHDHGYLDNKGILTNDSTAIQSNYVLAIAQFDGHLAKSSIAFDKYTTNKALTPKGTWETFLQSDDITGKVDKVTGATKDDITIFGDNGVLVDSGAKLSDYVPVTSESLEGKTTTILSLVQGLQTSGIDYKRYDTTSDGGSASISDKPTASTSKGFALECYRTRSVSDTDWEYQLMCRVHGDANPYTAIVTNSTTSISWSRLNTDTNTDTKVTQTLVSDNANYPLLFTPKGQTATSTTTATFDSGITANPSTNTITASLAGNATSSSYPAGFNSRATSINWGTLNTTGTSDYTYVTDWHTTGGADVAIATKNNVAYMQIDGKFYQNEGANAVLDTSDVTSLYAEDGTLPVNGQAVASAVASKVTANTAITGDTKLKITYDSKGLVTAGDDATLNDLVPMYTKTYTGLLASSNGNGSGSDFIPVTYKITDPNKHFKISYRLTASYTATDSKALYRHQSFGFVTGYSGGLQCYSCFNTIQDTGRRSFYYLVAYRPKTRTNDWYLGVSMYNCNLNTTTGNERSLTFEIIDCENCTITMRDSIANTDYATYYGNCDYRWGFDIMNNGLRESGDDNTTTNTYARDVIAYCGTGAGTADKSADMGQFVYKANSVTRVYLGNANTASSKLRLQINSQGYKDIYLLTASNTWTITSSTNKTMAVGAWQAFYNGTNWYMLGPYNASGISNDCALLNGQAGYAVKNVFVDGYTLTAGAMFKMYVFTANTSATALQLNVNLTGAKPVYINGTATSTSSYTLAAGWYTVMYDGTNYQVRNTGNMSYWRPIQVNGTQQMSSFTGTTLNLANGTNTTVTYESGGNIKFNVATTSTYSSTGTTPVNGTAIAAAIGTLDVDAITGAASKTITSISETDGKISATYSDISITKSQVSDFPTSMTPSAHTHGNITNTGALQTTDITIANGDKLVVTDASDSNKVARTSISFDGTTTTKALTQKGTFEAFAKAADITTAIQGLDVTAITGSTTQTITSISETDGKISATFSDIATMGAASASAAGTAGLVPAPAAGKQNSFLRGDGTWVVPTNTDTLVLQSASTTANYRPLVLGYQNDTTHSTLSNSVTQQVYTTNAMYAQPSTGMVAATSFKVGEKGTFQYNSADNSIDLVW